jgi:integrase
VIFFLGYTGVRYGEMVALRVRNLDLIKRRALIAEAVADVNGRAVFDTPKNHQRRAVPRHGFSPTSWPSTSRARALTTTSSPRSRAACCTCATFVATASTRPSATMTLDLFGHLFADQLDQVADAMDAARSRVQDHAD